MLGRPKSRFEICCTIRQELMSFGARRARTLRPGCKRQGRSTRIAPGQMAANDRTRQTVSGATFAMPGRSILVGFLVDDVFRLVFQLLELLAGLVLELLELRPGLVLELLELLAGLVLELFELRPGLVLQLFELLAGLVRGLARRGGDLLEFLARRVEHLASLLSALLDHRTGRRRGAFEFRAGTRFHDLLTQALGARLDGSAGFLEFGPGRFDAGFDLVAVASPGGDRERQAQRNSQSDLSVHGELLQDFFNVPGC